MKIELGDYSDYELPIDDVTVVVPFKRGGNKTWLRQAKSGFPHGQKIVIVENDGEMADALNDAITNHVSTPWVYRFDADDVAVPGLLHRLRDAVWDGSDAAYPAMALSSQDELQPMGIFNADSFCPLRLETHNYITGATLFKRDQFIAVGGYRDLPALEDWDLWLRMARAGTKFKPVPEAMFHYRQVVGSRNRLKPEEMEKVVRQITVEHPAAEAIATFYYQGTPMTAHLRCSSPAKYIPAVCQPVYHIPIEPREEQPRIRFPHQRGAAILQFGATQQDSMNARWLQLNGHPLFVEVDDNYTVTGGRIARRAGWQEKVIVKDSKGKVDINAQRASVEGHIRIVKSADGVICSTEYLAKQYRRLNRNVWVCPNQVEPSEWPEPPVRSPLDPLIRVGWFASPSHDKDWPLVRKALVWAGRQKNVRVIIMGLEVRDSELNHTQIAFHDDWGVYRVALGQLDIGLAPILQTPWSLGRSDLKALDYAMGNACPVLQDEAPYDAWVHGENCWKAKTPEDWLRAVKYLVNDRARAAEIAAAARAYTLTERTFEQNAWRWRDAIASAERTAITDELQAV